MFEERTIRNQNLLRFDHVQGIISSYPGLNKMNPATEDIDDEMEKWKLVWVGSILLSSLITGGNNAIVCHVLQEAGKLCDIARHQDIAVVLKILFGYVLSLRYACQFVSMWRNDMMWKEGPSEPVSTFL